MCVTVGVWEMEQTVHTVMKQRYITVQKCTLSITPPAVSARIEHIHLIDGHVRERVTIHVIAELRDTSSKFPKRYFQPS